MNQKSKTPQPDPDQEKKRRESLDGSAVKQALEGK